jgi:hypothetical protein
VAAASTLGQYALALLNALLSVHVLLLSKILKAHDALYAAPKTLDAGSGPELVTRASGDVRDAIGRPVEAGQLAAVDPDCRCIALHLYDGQLKVRAGRH